jgi:hypothetical protein
MRTLMILTLTMTLAGLLVAGCERLSDPFSSSSAATTETAAEFPEGFELDRDLIDQVPSMALCHQSPPGPTVTVAFGESSKTIWPYTGENFSGTPQDPINLIFVGQADPRDIRAALMSLDGDRSGTPFPPVPPFTCTWEDAIGDVQTGYAEPEGWTGGVVQLACGVYEEARFHMRMFRMGDWTVANAHFEVLIPGTSDHQVLSWELAEQFVVADLVRSGLLDATAPMGPTGQINDAPFRTIPAMIYNGIPVELRMLIGGPLENVSEDVPIGTDGSATILNLAGSMERHYSTWQQDMVINYDQVIPKPFCASGPEDYVYVQGPVELTQTVRLTPGGHFTMVFHAQGQLTVVPVNPLTGEPIAEPMTARVFEYHSGSLSDRNATNASLLFQRLLPPSDPNAGWLFKRLHVTDHGRNGFQELTRCSSGS